MACFLDFSHSEIEEYFLSIGQPKYRATQALSEYYNKLSFERLTALPLSVRERLAVDFPASPIEIEEEFISGDGTRKFLYRLADGNLIEGVLMEYKYGNTLCVSTQVGCRMGCAFCASTVGGLVRSLSAGEILGQVLVVNRHLGGSCEDRKVTNVVLMGSGEPMDNFDNVVKFICLVSNERGINVSVRNISLSSCGLCDRIRELADLNLGVTLSISLHSANQGEREKIMPIAKKFSLEQVISAAKYYFQKTGRRVIFEYTAIKDVNVSSEDARALAALVRGFPCHINVILLNPVQESGLSSPGKKEAYRFVGELEKNGVSATLRRQMGVDIEGACGQLRRKYLNFDKNV